VAADGLSPLSTDKPPPCCAGAGADVDAAGFFAGAAAVVLKVEIPTSPMHALAQESWQTTGQPLQAALQSLRQLASAARGDAASTTKYRHSTAAACTLVAAISERACRERTRRRIGGRDDDDAAGPG